MTVSKSGARSTHVAFERERGVYALHVTHGVGHAVIQVGEDANRTSRILHLFRALGDAGIPVFLIKMHSSVITLALAGADIARAEEVLTKADFPIETRRDLAVVAIRAASMRDLHGVMIDIADALYEAEATLYECGDSHNSVQCLIEGARVAAAVEALRRTFKLSPEAVNERSIEAEAAE